MYTANTLEQYFMRLIFRAKYTYFKICLQKDIVANAVLPVAPRFLISAYLENADMPEKCI